MLSHLFEQTQARGRSYELYEKPIITAGGRSAWLELEPSFFPILSQAL